MATATIKQNLSCAVYSELNFQISVHQLLKVQSLSLISSIKTLNKQKTNVEQKTNQFVPFNKHLRKGLQV